MRRGDVLRGIISCPLCARSGGHMRRGARVCSKCEAQLRPTPLQAWRAATAISVEELARAARVSRDTLQVALRGEPVSARTAARLSKVTKIDPLLIRVGRVRGV